MSLRPVTPSELDWALNKLGKNKSTGPSGLSAEMLLHASPAARAKYILPFANSCLRNKNTPSYLKRFYVWCIEKVKGVGPIMHPTKKLDVRPISLYEISYKLVETILAERISAATNPKLHPAQHAFNSLRSVVDAITTYTLVMEDANQFHKEIHISNNDCTQAYDAVPPWAMKAVYRYHGFPPDLIDMLMNMDADRVGRVLTAHGPGTEFTMNCGLGQGSVLAPLKWNLFLDPLMKQMDDTPDPYIMSDGKTTRALRVLAFADDTTIFASSHAGYLSRMAMATTYFGYFGVNFSPAKTHYTYANTQGLHYKSAPITVRMPDGTTHVQRSAVTSPHKPLRYLGAWLSPTLNWKPAKRKLNAEVNRLLTILRHKTFTPTEYRYIIQSVLHSKMRYYLTVVPMTDTELDSIDNKIASIMKKRMHMASSCSSPLLFLPEADYGAELPSIKDTRATNNIKLAHAMLNDTHSAVGDIIRIRLSHLRDHLGMAHSPLQSPSLVPMSCWEGHWCARIAHHLHSHGGTIGDTLHYNKRPGSRHKDTPIVSLLPKSTQADLRPSLLRHMLIWLGQISNPQGTSLAIPNRKINQSSAWWTSLKKATCVPHTNQLKTPVSPTTSHIRRFVPTHRPGTIVTSPVYNHTNNTWHNAHHNRYFKITDSFRGPEGRETSYVQELFPVTTPITDIARDGPFCKVKKMRGTPYWIPENNEQAVPGPRVEEYTDALFPVNCEWVKAIPENCFPCDLAIIHIECVIKARYHLSVRGQTTRDTLNSAIHTMRSRTDADGGYNPPTSPLDTVCSICTLPDTDSECTTRSCDSKVHARCTPRQQPWKCPVCAPKAYRPPPLTRKHLKLLRKRMIHHTIYSASDGSVLRAGTMDPSSTFGITIDPASINVSHKGKIDIRQGEESSLRVEIEGLIQAYYLIPPDIPVRHAVDNKGTVDIHDHMVRHGLRSDKSLLKQHYHSSIRRLHAAMNARGTPLTVVHTLSHLEHIETSDLDLRERREALSTADAAASDAHDAHLLPVDTSGDEPFPLFIQDVIVEKTVPSPFALIQRNKRIASLYERKMEGSNARAGTTPTWSSGRRSWPTYLRTFAHKLWTKRLPTAYARTRRGDTEDGEPVMPWCPHCLQDGNFTAETQEHLIQTCPHLTNSRFKLARTLNNIFRESAQPQAITPRLTEADEFEHLENIGIGWDITQGWTAHTTDKHGRESLICRGPQGRALEGTKLLTSWAHNILNYCENSLPRSEHREYILSLKPDMSLDPHLLQGIASAINANHITDNIPHNPFIPATTTSNFVAPSGAHPVVVNSVDTEQNWADIATHLTDDRTWVLLASPEQSEEIERHLHYETKIQILPNSIYTWGQQFWAGTTSLFPDTHEDTILVYTSNNRVGYRPKYFPISIIRYLRFNRYR